MINFGRRVISCSGVSFVSTLGKADGLSFSGRSSGWSRAICFCRSAFQSSTFIFFKAVYRSFMTLLYTVALALAVRSSSFKASVIISCLDISSTSLEGSDDLRTSSLSLTISPCIKVSSLNLTPCVVGGFESTRGFRDSALGSLRFLFATPSVGVSK